MVLSFRVYKDYQTGRQWDMFMCICMPKIIIEWHNLAKLLYQ